MYKWKLYWETVSFTVSKTKKTEKQTKTKPSSLTTLMRKELWMGAADEICMGPIWAGREEIQVHKDIGKE